MGTHAWRLLCDEAKRVYPWTCHLCGQAIQPEHRNPHPESWTLDHLDPVATHGDALPALERTLPAHRRCNVRRGYRPHIAPSPRSEQW